MHQALHCLHLIYMPMNIHQSTRFSLTEICLNAVSFWCTSYVDIIQVNALVESCGLPSEINLFRDHSAFLACIFDGLSTVHGGTVKV